MAAGASLQAAVDLKFTGNLARTIQDSAMSSHFDSTPASETSPRDRRFVCLPPLLAIFSPSSKASRRTRGIPPLAPGELSRTQQPLFLHHLIKSAWFFSRSSFSSLSASPRRTNRLPPRSPPALATSSDVRCFFLSSSALSRSILCVPRLGKPSSYLWEYTGFVPKLYHLSL